MRLAEVFDTDYYERAAKPNLLKLQQAFSEIGWECKFERPSPIDDATGEIFPWLLIATNDETQNTLTFAVRHNSVSGNIGPEQVTLDPHASMEQWAQELKTEYEAEIEVLDQDLYSAFDSDITRSAIDEWVENALDEAEEHGQKRALRYNENVLSALKSKAKAHMKKKYLQAELRDWERYHSAKSSGLVNSKKLADRFKKVIEDAFEDAWERAAS